MLNRLYLIICNLVPTLICLFIVRIFIVIMRIRKSVPVTRATLFVKIMVILGSGGHTFEMLQLLKDLNKKFQPRIYVIAETDNLSEQKVKSFMETMPKHLSVPNDLSIIERIPRSREVGQSWVSTVFTTFRAFITAFILVLKHKPDLLLCNGPGTCVPLCVAAFLSHVLGLKHIKIVYVESICRVKTMSLSGKIVYHIADRFFIQWPQLKDKYPRAKYMGKLI